MDKRKVLFLTSWYPSKVNATLGNFVEKHAQCASKAAQVTVLYATSRENLTETTIEEFNANGLRTVIVYFPKIRSKLVGLTPILKLRKYFAALKKGYAHINESFDLVHLNVTYPAGLFALALKRKFQTPYVLLAHWTGYLNQKGDFKRFPFWKKTLHRRIFLGARKVLAVSTHLGNALTDLRLVKDFTVFPNVVSSDYFYPRNTTNQDASKALKILHVSSCDDEHKNISGMLSAIQHLAIEYELHIITESSIAHVEDIISSVGFPAEKVKLTSRVHASEIGAAFRQSDVFVLFSNFETFSVVLAEAWMSGVPAIYAKCGGLTEVKHDGLGVQISVNDNDALRQAIENFQKSDYSSAVISEYAQRFDSEYLAKKLKNIYRNIFIKIE